ncbi:MAG: hypothetical protein RLZZ628_2849 [Bacteroidota bacterium]|jgi:hypothetical protein
MKQFIITVKSESAAQALEAFLKTIGDMEQEHHVTDVDANHLPNLVRGNYKPTDTPSDFAGIWKNRNRRSKS